MGRYRQPASDSFTARASVLAANSSRRRYVPSHVCQTPGQAKLHGALLGVDQRGHTGSAEPVCLLQRFHDRVTRANACIGSAVGEHD